jgi:hypothetical protein
VWTVRGLVTYYTLFVIELESRRVHIVGSTPHRDEAFMLQAIRHLTDDLDGVLNCAYRKVYARTGTPFRGSQLAFESSPCVTMISRSQTWAVITAAQTCLTDGWCGRL